MDQNIGKKETSMVKKVYLMVKRDADDNNNYNNLNWAYHVKYTLSEIGMTNLWLNQNGSNFLYKTIEQRITDIFKQKWYSYINNSSRLESYSIYKHSFEREKYLKCVSNDKFRIALSRFRLSSHPLAIELGRHFFQEKIDFVRTVIKMWLKMNTISFSPAQTTMNCVSNI